MFRIASLTKVGSGVGLSGSGGGVAIESARESGALESGALESGALESEGLESEALESETGEEEGFI